MANRAKSSQPSLRVKAALSKSHLVESSLGPWFSFKHDQLSTRIGELFDQQYDDLIRSLATSDNPHAAQAELDRQVAIVKGEVVRLITEYVAQELPHAFEDLVAQQIEIALVRAWNLREENGQIVGDKIEAKHVEHLIKKWIGVRKKQLGVKGRGGDQRSKNKFAKFEKYYNECLPLFQEADRLQRRKEFSRLPITVRRQALTSAYPNLPPDLIEEGLNRYNNRPLDPDTAPANLAAEWAGRQCGLSADRPDREYPRAQLRQRHTKQRRRQ